MQHFPNKQTLSDVGTVCHNGDKMCCDQVEETKTEGSVLSGVSCVEVYERTASETRSSPEVLSTP